MDVSCSARKSLRDVRLPHPEYHGGVRSVGRAPGRLITAAERSLCPGILGSRTNSPAGQTHAAPVQVAGVSARRESLASPFQVSEWHRAGDALADGDRRVLGRGERKEDLRAVGRDFGHSGADASADLDDVLDPPSPRQLQRTCGRHGRHVSVEFDEDRLRPQDFHHRSRHDVADLDEPHPPKTYKPTEA